MGIFKVSRSQCQQKQMWKQMVMTKSTFLLEGGSLIPPLALVLEITGPEEDSPFN